MEITLENYQHKPFYQWWNFKSRGKVSSSKKQSTFKKKVKKLAIASKSLVILTLGQGPSSLFKETNFSILKNQNWEKIDIRCVYYNLTIPLNYLTAISCHLGKWKQTFIDYHGYSISAKTQKEVTEYEINVNTLQ